MFSVRVKNVIREEIAASKYCLVIDEARDESKKQKQMSIVLRYDNFEIKDAIYSYLSHYNLDIQNIRGQSYDGVSNMRAKNVTRIHQLFGKLTFIVNMVGASCKNNDELKEAHAYDIAYLISINELETGRGLNQINSQMQEINVCFSENAMELLMLTSALNPQNASDSLKYLDICKLVEKFYPRDFTSKEREWLDMQLKHYEHNVVKVKGSYYKSLSTISELCQWLVKTKKMLHMTLFLE
ncbi:uncharacterized protein [Primulina eburnea]|uniref:uncharacterized protein n=1 Tax=Primulina eburnea TaxID=1245227 RepID=UPI003C6BDE4A